MRIAFIICSGHCGSTPLDLILDSHSMIIGLGEFVNLKKDNLCTCGEIIRECSLWSDVINNHFKLKNLNVVKSLSDFYFNREIYYAVENKQFNRLNDENDLLELNYNIYKQILTKNNVQILIDSSKNIDRVSFLAQHENIDPIIIHLVRDGRAVMWSYIKKYGKKISMISLRSWFITNLKTEIFARENKYKYICIRYKDFTNNPEKILKKILTILNLQYEPEMLQYRHFKHHQVGGNRMRFRQDETIKEDTSWKNHLPKKSKLIHDLIFGWMMYYYKKKNKFDYHLYHIITFIFKILILFYMIYEYFYFRIKVRKTINYKDSL